MVLSDSVAMLWARDGDFKASEASKAGQQIDIAAKSEIDSRLISSL